MRLRAIDPSRPGLSDQRRRMAATTAADLAAPARYLRHAATRSPRSAAPGPGPGQPRVPRLAGADVVGDRSHHRPGGGRRLWAVHNSAPGAAACAGRFQGRTAGQRERSLSAARSRDDLQAGRRLRPAAGHPAVQRRATPGSGPGSRAPARTRGIAGALTHPGRRRRRWRRKRPVTNRGRDAELRDRALRRSRLATAGGLAGALGLTGAFSTAAAVTFSGKPVAAPAKPPRVPVATAPVQQAPPPPLVVVRTVHHAARTGWVGAPAPPAQAPRPIAVAPAPAPPPPPPCVSTPSHPC